MAGRNTCVVIIFYAYLSIETAAARCLEANQPNISNCFLPLNLSVLAQPESFSTGNASSVDEVIGGAAGWGTDVGGFLY